jgi:hypothetical protein
MSYYHRLLVFFDHKFLFLNINLGILAIEHAVDLVKLILSNSNSASFIDNMVHFSLMEAINATDIIISTI